MSQTLHCPSKGRLFHWLMMEVVFVQVEDLRGGTDFLYH
jgi:hypothetical protein